MATAYNRRPTMGFIDSIAGDWVGTTALLAVGVVALLLGGHLLVDGGIALARRMGISTLLIGMTVIAFGTSAPELAVNMIAALDEHTALSFGNVIGSNIANIGLVLGLGAMVSSLPVSGRVLRIELYLLLGVSLIASLMAWYGWLALVGGLFLLLGLGTVVGVTWFRLARQDRRDPFVAEALEAMDAPARPAAAGVLLVLAGTLLLAAGGKLTEVGAVGVATLAGVGEVVIGVTIVAIATSLPEVVATIIAATKGHGDLAVGNVVGSNFFNLLVVLGVTAVIHPVDVPAVPTLALYLGAMLVLTLALLWPIGRLFPRPAAAGEGVIRRWEGGALLACYAVFILLVVRLA